MKTIRIFAVALGIATFFATGQAFAALVGHYTFDGNANDSSGNGKHGTAAGGAALTSDRFGNPNSAYSFDGFDDRIELPLIYTQDQDPLTISAWLKITNRSGEVGTIFGEFTGTNTRNFFVLGSNTTDGSLNFDQFNPSGGGVFFDANWSQRRGEWLHVAVVKDVDIVSMYLDGILLGSAAHTETYSGPEPLFAAIGSRPINGDWSGFGGGQYSFEGSIDDVRIYDHALSGADIQNLSSVPVPAAIWLLGSGLIGLLGMRKKS